MELLETKEDKMIFSIDVEDSLANAIRRYVNQIPVLAIDEVEIIKNDSALYDETVSQKLKRSGIDEIWSSDSIQHPSNTVSITPSLMPHIKKWIR